MTETVHINVGGMTCAACQSHVQHALEETPGVRKAAVNLMTADATVVFDPAQSPPRRCLRPFARPGMKRFYPLLDEARSRTKKRASVNRSTRLGT